MNDRHPAPEDCRPPMTDPSPTVRSARSAEVIVVSPGGTTTGGPEALHELVDSINRQGGSAAVLYWPPKEDWSVPERYAHHDVPVVTMEAVPMARSVVLPEIYTHLRREFPASRVGIWWLSVDNFFVFLPRARTRAGRRLLRLGGRRFHRRLARRHPGLYLRGFDFHLSQSNYATEFLAAHGISSFFTGDHVRAIGEDETLLDLGAVVTNGNKGIAQRQRFEALHPQLSITPLTGLSALEVAGALRSATIYLDFGLQPGRDRMPREAAIRDCVVLARRAGGGANDRDMAIPARCRFDDTEDEFRRIGALVAEILAEPTPALAAQASYRTSVLGEYESFDRAVAEFFEL